MGYESCHAPCFGDEKKMLPSVKTVEAKELAPSTINDLGSINVLIISVLFNVSVL